MSAVNFIAIGVLQERFIRLNRCRLAYTSLALVTLA